MAVSLLAPAGAFAADEPVVEANIQAHPALWTVHAQNATAYLLGAIHILPPNVLWHTPMIDSACSNQRGQAKLRCVSKRW